MPVERYVLTRGMIALSTLVTTTLASGPAMAQDGGSAPGRRPVPRLTPRLSPRPPAQQPPSAPAPAPATKPPTEPAAPAPSPAAEPPSAAARAAPSASVPPSTAVETASPSVGAFSPPVLLAYRGMEPPSGYVLERSYNRGLLIGGGLTLGVTYISGLIYGASQKFEGGMGVIAVPVLGPWLALGKRKFNCDTSVTPDLNDPLGSAQTASDAADVCQELLIEETKVAVVLFGLGLGQLAGTIITTVGLADRKSKWLRADLAGVDVQFDAVATPGFSGLTAFGTF